MSFGTEKTLRVQKMMENGRRSCSMHDSVTINIINVINDFLFINIDHIQKYSLLPGRVVTRADLQSI